MESIDGISLATRGKLTAVGGPNKMRAAHKRTELGRFTRRFLAEAMREARAEGASFAAISRATGIAPSTIRTLIAENHDTYPTSL
jgi:hypothetical protein